MAMTPSQIGVTIAGIATVGWIYWHFFVAARGSAVQAVTTAGAQEVTVVVDGGYAPSVVDVRAGRLVRLNFDRKDRGSCTEEVVLPDFGIRRFLPTGITTTVEFTPLSPGSYQFACGMGMVHGQLRVRE
jgi:plastocyanin domain-containing protein